MSRVFWGAAFFLLLVAFALQVGAVKRHIEERQPRILTTEHSLALIPLAFDLPSDAMYLRPYSEPYVMRPPGTLRYVQALLPIYAGAFFFGLREYFFMSSRAYAGSNGLTFFLPCSSAPICCSLSTTSPFV
jgi:hypothetical protein